LTVAGAAGRLTVGSVAGQLVFLGLSPLLARIYDPTDFAILAIFLAFACVDVIACCGYERAIFLPDNAADAARVGCVAAGCCLLVALVATSAILALSSFGHWELLSGISVWLPWAVGFEILLAGLLQIAMAAMLRQNRYGIVATARSLQLPTAAICQIGLGAVDAGGAGLVLGHIGGMMAGAVFLTATGRGVRREIRSLQAGELLAIARRYSKFPRFSLLGSGLNSLCLQLPPAAIVKLFGAVAGGSFNFGMRLGGAAVNTVTQAAGQALISLLSGGIRHGHRQGELDTTVRTMGILLICITLPMVGLLAFAPMIFDLVFGPAWHQAGELLRIMTPMIASQLLITPFHGVLDLLERQDIHLKRELIRATLLAFSFGTVVLLGLTVEQAAFLIAIAGTAGYWWGARQIWTAYRQWRQQAWRA
jgi:O-antigen/teichoic acid export membrane protein